VDRNLAIASIMTPRPVCVEADLKLDRAKDLMESHKVRQLPVTRFGDLAGILTERNLKAYKSSPFRYDLTAADVMDVDPYIVPPETDARSVLRDMLDFKIEFAVVARDERKPVGIFTRQDALALLLGRRRSSRKGALRLVSAA
jgi:CBS domain-containing protein